jgi:hypothetical protein
VALRKPKNIKIRVYNATNRPGLADTVSTEFKNRGFQTQKPRDSKKAVDAVARLRFGPKAVGSAHLIRAYFLALPRENLQYDPKSKSDVVDVVIGSEFLQLATTTEVNQSLAAMGEPALPPGACPAPPPKDAAQ